ncbi:MerR family transcriptional regulator [Kocuria sp. cx-116]|uniref:MerR family transcriptional regulator n=1 Tax=Kocuria sp. cx-116 TaxID=2771378 RepID=UPI002A4E276F|nr:MerR family transcriptional regulator [Kocuria sp. cx-116]
MRDAEAMTHGPQVTENPPGDELLTVGAASSLLGVSVRTLHHWDHIGLVSPSGRSSAGYRLYSADDVARIHRVLVYRELGFSLTEVGEILDDPSVNESAHLEKQRALLAERIDHLQQMVCAVDHMMEAHAMNKKLTPQEQSEIFGQDWNPEYQREAEERWGDTDQWEQSQQRAAGMSTEDWQRIKADGDQLNRDLAQAARDGIEPGSKQANQLAERHRESIAQFYDCSHAMQVCLATMYTQDPRFTEYYETLEPGLADWLYRAVAENARAHGVDPDTATWE